MKTCNQTCQPLLLEEMFIILDSKPTVLFSRGRSYVYFPRLFTLETFERSSVTKAINVSGQKIHRSMVGSGSGSLVRLQSSYQFGLQSSEGLTGPEGSAFLFMQMVVGSVPHCCSLEASALCHKGLSTGLTAHNKSS